MVLSEFQWKEAVVRYLRKSNLVNHKIMPECGCCFASHECSLGKSCYWLAGHTGGLLPNLSVLNWQERLLLTSYCCWILAPNTNRKGAVLLRPCKFKISTTQKTLSWGLLSSPVRVLCALLECAGVRKASHPHCWSCLHMLLSVNSAVGHLSRF